VLRSLKIVVDNIDGKVKTVSSVIDVIESVAHISGKDQRN